MDPVQHFYDQLADSYHLIFHDLRSTVRRHGEVLDRLVRERLGDRPRTILDCSCGIGTQAIGLALRGHAVHGTDLSPQQIARAQREAAEFGVHVTFGVADMRALTAQVEGQYDVVVSCDNSLPHLLTDRDLQSALNSIAQKLRSGGVFLASIRDYDHIVTEHPGGEMPRYLQGPPGTRIVFQVWDWRDDGRTYTAHLFILSKTPMGWTVAHHETPYRALLRADLSHGLVEAGLTEVRWHMPEETTYYQPIVTALKPPRRD